MYFIFLLLISASAEHIILKEGSINEQTYGKDGLMLFHYDYPDYWQRIIQNTKQNITFFEVNCQLFDVCNVWSDTFPHLVYSVDNKMWKPVDSDNLEVFIFETFEKRCVYNRLKCKEHELDTLLLFDEESPEVIQLAIDDLRNKVSEIEATFADYYQKIQNEFEKKRIEMRDKLEQAEDSIKILEDLI